MTKRVGLRTAVSTCAVVLVIVGIEGCSRKPPAPMDGAALFEQKCASCHKVNNDMRAPEPEGLRHMTKATILRALESGRMKWEGKLLSSAKKNAIAEYLGASATEHEKLAGAFCARDLDPPPNPPEWMGWGADLGNTRAQSENSAGLKRDQIKGLKLKWAFGFPGAYATYSQPTSAAGRVFVGSEDGTVYALDAATGCVWWMYKAPATVKTAIAVGNQGDAAFFGDTNGIVYGVKVTDGTLAWQTRPETHAAARITGSPLLIGRRLYVPVSSGEEGSAADASYPCCTFRGSIVALDTLTGKQVWKAYTIEHEAMQTGKSAHGVQHWGPAGAPIWSTPTADLKRHLIYVTTGNNYSPPTTESSDAVIAFDMRNGKRKWSRQLTPGDAWNSGCVAEKKDNCPGKHGNDYDFGAAPILKTLRGGRDILVLAQKSGVVYGIDPDRRGKVLWKRRIGNGGPLGGIEWGGAADDEVAYFPLSDFDFDHPLGGGGLFALNLRTGKEVWHVAPERPACSARFGCSAAQMAPPTLIPGVVFAGSLDGHLRAYDTRDGSILWDFDTSGQFKTSDGVTAHGGSVVGSGPTIVDGRVFINSGYTNAMEGNVLLAFTVE